MSIPSAVDQRHMARALELAARGLWTTDPNPRVGCVIADGERVLGEGWHERAGEAHAERAALAAANAPVAGATAYVTLEPCCHHGRTPPCADALIEAGIARVWYGSHDPNPRVDGGGLARLAAAGIAVAGPLFEPEARALNPGFLSRMERGRPWVRIAEPRAESLERSRRRASAVLTSAARVRADDPRLDVQAPGARQPLRLVIDTRLAIPAAARILAPPGQAIVLTASDDADRRSALEAVGARVLRVSEGPGGVDLMALMRRLAELEINELAVEAGATLAGAFRAAGLVDEETR